jgi:hypothetical protein
MVGLMVVSARVASAETPTVTTLADSGDGSLRHAISAASPGDTISFAPELNGGTIALTTGELVIGKDLTIEGPGADQLAVSGSNASRVFDIGSGVHVSISDLEIRNGLVYYDGGGISNAGTLTLANTSVSGNRVSYYYGGGIYNTGTLVITNTTISGNGAGTANYHPRTCGSWPFSYDCSYYTYDGGLGGGIYNTGTLVITNTTISGNYDYAPIESNGSGIHTLGPSELTYVTLYGTNGRNLYSGGSQPVTLENTIVAGRGGQNCSGAALDSAGNNLEDGASCNFTKPTDQQNTDPMLEPLADNGGPTRTHALKITSPAIDNATAVEGISADQRGVSRPHGGGYDIGAFELEALAAPTIDLESPSDSGTSDTDNITNDAAAAFVGTAPPGSIVELFDGADSLGEVSADELVGSWSFEAPVLGEGVHRITAIATDVEGRTSAPSDVLEVRIDLTAPETIIDSHPANLVNNTTATFGFSSNEDNSTFMGVLDEDSYGEVSSPTTYTGLSNGGHIFKVRAEDLAGNVDPSAATYSWEVDALKPTTTTPVQALKQNERLGTSRIPVSLEWSATDNTGGSGIAFYELKQSKDGAAYTSVALADPAATSITLDLERGSTYRYQVRAQDAAGNWSAWVAGPRFSVAAYQENSSVVSYPNGTWTRSALSGAYGGYVKYAKVQGATARLAFTGRNVAWVATKAPSRGTAEVYVDGTKVATVDLYSATTQTRTMAFSKGWGVSGSHTMTIKVLGAPTGRSIVDVDALVVLN